jgi:hypothetical protein
VRLKIRTKGLPALVLRSVRTQKSGLKENARVTKGQEDFEKEEGEEERKVKGQTRRKTSDRKYCWWWVTQSDRLR